MELPDDRSTSPTLLKKVADWYDREAWVRFRDTRFEPLGGRAVKGNQAQEVARRSFLLSSRTIAFMNDGALGLSRF